jgi:Family of unknown function (DUF6364)
MSKLILTLNPEVVSRAKRYAKEHGTSVSAMVEAYLSEIVRRPPGESDTPVLDSVRGVLRKADINDYRRHLESKYH